MSRRRRLFLALWAAGVVAVTAPWFSFQFHSHWYRVIWVPFTGIVRPLRESLDVGLNVLLYVPLGLLCASSRRSGVRDIAAVAAPAFALSVLMEVTQVYSHGRQPSATDVTSNVAGALLGLFLARRVRKH